LSNKEEEAQKKIDELAEELTMQRVNISDEEIIFMVSRLNPEILDEN
jgi:hypothetical protein